METTRGTHLKIVLAVVLALMCGWAIARADTFGPSDQPATRPVAQVVDDAGDQQATTTFDGPMVRRRAAIALHLAKGADAKLIARQLQAQAKREKIGPLTEASFAVFSETMLNYFVPEMTMVLPEGVTTGDGEVMMRDHHFTGVTFYVVDNVLVHDLTFGVIPNGVTPEAAQRQQDQEGVLADSLNHYTTLVQRSGLTVRYFGAIISDGQVRAVRESMARAAHVAPEQVAVVAAEPGEGVDLSQGVPILTDDLASQHHHG